MIVRKTVPVAFALLVACLAVAGPHLGVAKAQSPGDPPLLVPWSRIGNIALGETRASVERKYGSAGHGFHVVQRYGENVEGYYELHGSNVSVTFYGDRVGAIWFGTPYYRTKTGFGVGSKIPLGPCHKTATHRCGHRWRGFLWKEYYREGPCSCWVKVGLGRQSLPPTVDNFLKPWFFIYISHGRVEDFRFDSKFVD